MLSSNFNRFYHGVVLKQLKDCTILKTDIEIKKGLYFEFSPTRLNLDSVKQLLKAINLAYPKTDDKPKSTAKLENIELLDHIEYLINLAGNSGYTLQFVADEWENLKLQAGIL